MAKKQKAATAKMRKRGRSNLARVDRTRSALVAERNKLVAKKRAVDQQRRTIAKQMASLMDTVHDEAKLENDARFAREVKLTHDVTWRRQVYAPVMDAIHQEAIDHDMERDDRAATAIGLTHQPGGSGGRGSARNCYTSPAVW